MELFILTLQGRIENTTINSSIQGSRIEPLLEQVRVGEVGGNTLLTVGQDQTGVWPAPGPRLRQVCLRRGGESPQCLLCTEQFPGEPGPDHWEVREGGKLF